LQRGLEGGARGVVGGETCGHGGDYGVRERAVHAAVTFVVDDEIVAVAAGAAEGYVGGGGRLGEDVGGEEEGGEEKSGGFHFEGLVGFVKSWVEEIGLR
jgi:hypothetical protein